MQPIDFNQLLDSAALRNSLPPGAVPVDGIYQGDDGLQFRSQSSCAELIQDLVRLSTSAYLFASSYSPRDEQRHCQIVNDSDCIHIQFRLRGSGREYVSAADVIEIPERSCVIARYPQGSIVHRTTRETPCSKVVCLVMNPQSVSELMDVSASGLPDSASWLSLGDRLPPYVRAVPLQSAMVLAVNDILGCTFKGAVRRAYMRAKALELLTMAVDALGKKGHGIRMTLSDSDTAKIVLSRAVMIGNLESTLTLAELARHVGLNRTKLALGFKEVYGTSVQAFWRDTKLNRARELLQDNGTRITDVALSMGYSEISSFTRAFGKKFGISPRDCRSS